MVNRGSANDVYDVAKHSSGDGIQEHDIAQEFSSDSPSMATSSSAPSGSSPFASSSLPPASKGNGHDSGDVAFAGSVSDVKKLEHALPSGPMQSPAGLGMVDSMGRPPVGFTSNHDIAPGAFPVRLPRNTATSRTFRSPLSSYDSPREFTNEESKLEEGLTNSAATGSGLYTVEAQRVPDGNEDGAVIVAEAEHVRTKWYQRRWITLGLALFACVLVGTVVVMVVLFVRQPTAAASSSSLTPIVPSIEAPSTTYPTTASPRAAPMSEAPTTPDPTAVPPTPKPTNSAPPTPHPTAATISPVAASTSSPVAPPTTPPVAPPTRSPVAPPTTSPVAPPTISPVAPPTRAPTARAIPTSKPTSLTPLGIACNFLSIPDVTTCRSTSRFGGATTGFTIPSEIGLLTQLTYLEFRVSIYVGPIVTEFTNLDFDITSTTSYPLIPSITAAGACSGEVMRNTWIYESNSLTSTIPSEIGRLTNLTHLNFAGNSLSSTIPSEIGLLTKLTELSFNDNALSSTIPSEIGLLTKLTELSFNDNALSSTIPSEIGLLTQLTYLDFSDNALTSAIPSEIGLLTQLTWLNVLNNTLTGTIPSEIGRLTQLERLHLSDNELKGTIPSSLCSLLSPPSIYIDGGEITCVSGCCC